GGVADRPKNVERWQGLESDHSMRGAEREGFERLIDCRDARVEKNRRAQRGDPPADERRIAALNGPRSMSGGPFRPAALDRIQISDVHLFETVAIDVGARQFDGIANRLILLAAPRVRADRAAVAQIDDADYAHRRPGRPAMLCSLPFNMNSGDRMR